YLLACANAFDDIFAINALSALSVESEVVKSTFDSFLDDRLPSAELGLEDLHNVALHTFLTRFDNGEIKSKTKRREIELDLSRSLHEHIHDLQESQQKGRGTNVFPPAHLVWYLSKSKILSDLLLSDIKTLVSIIAKFQDADGAWRVPDWWSTVD